MIDPLPVAFLGNFGDAFEFIVSGRESVTAGQEVGGPEQVLELTAEHLKVTFLALGLGLAIALPAGLTLGHYGKGERFAVPLGNAGRAIPELALIALFIAFFGATLVNITIALAIMAIPPILTNSFVGVRQVDRGAVEAARGMGMTDAGIIAKVELPLAVPTIMAGVRTGAINVVATATIAPLGGVLTLGDFILARNVYGDAGVLAGAILVAALALLLELGLAGAQWALTPRGLKLQRA